MNPLFLTSLVSAHSWLDCIGLASTKYTGNPQYYGEEDFKKACIGFPRAYPGRLDRDIGPKFTYPMEGRKPDNFVCKEEQRTRNYNPAYPMTKVKAGTQLKLWYEADGHANRPTTVQVHWTKAPNTDLVRYHQLNDQTKFTEFAFATPNNCMDFKLDNSLCWGFMTIPPNISPGVYSFVWNFPWNQNPVGDEYTTCFDIEVTK